MALMTREDIRTAEKNGYSNWEILAMVVDSGKEFPDAVWLVSEALMLPHDEVVQMQHDYD